MTTRTNTNLVLETHNIFTQTQGPQGREVLVRGRRLKTGDRPHSARAQARPWAGMSTRSASGVTALGRLSVGDKVLEAGFPPAAASGGRASASRPTSP